MDVKVLTMCICPSAHVCFEMLGLERPCFGERQPVGWHPYLEFARVFIQKLFAVGQELPGFGPERGGDPLPTA